MGSFLRRFSMVSRGLMLATLVAMLPALASAQATVVQATSNTAPSTTSSIKVTFTASQTAGNLNLVVVGWADTTSTVQSVTDAEGNTYILAAGTNATTGVSQAIYYAKNIAGDSAPATNAVTVTFSQIPKDEDVRILEISGLDATNPLDVDGGGFGSAATAPADSGPVTTNSATDLLIGAGTSTNSFSATDANYTAVPFPGGYKDVVEYRNVTAAGTYNATATPAGNWVMQIVAFRTAASTISLPAPTVSSVSPTTGGDAGGDSITITGTNFAPGATVVFSNGTMSASAVNCSVAPATSITCTTPDFPVGAANITVTNVDDQNSGAFVGFSFTATTPVVTNITPLGGSTNGGTQITITGNDFVAGASVVVGNVVADSVQVQNITTIIANVPAHSAGAVTVSVTNPNQHTGALPNGYTYAAPSSGVGFVQVQDVAMSGTQATVNATYALAQAAGDLNVVVISWADTTATVQSVKDSAGNTYVQALNPVAANGLSQAIYYAANIKAASASGNAVTVTFNGTATTPDLRILEYSGVDKTSPVDTGMSAASSAAGTVADTGSFTASNAHDVVIAAVTPSTTVSSGGPGFVTVNLPTSGDYIEHQITSAAGKVDATANLSMSGNWVIQAVAFKAVSAPPPTASFTLTASPNSNTVNPGSSATYTLSVTPQNGFSATVNLSCTAPSGVGISCSVSPSSVTPNGGVANATVTVNTTGPTASLLAPRHMRNQLPLYALWLPLPGIALAGIGFGSRRRKLGLGLASFLLIALTLLLAGCGGGGSSSGGGGGGTGGTAAGNYSITVTATSASQATQTTTLTLTVQ